MDQAAPSVVPKVTIRLASENQIPETRTGDVSYSPGCGETGVRSQPHTSTTRLANSHVERRFDLCTTA